MAGVDEALENLEQDADIIEVQTGSRLVEHEKRGLDVGGAGLGEIGEVANEFEALAFAASIVLINLAEAEVAGPTSCKSFQAGGGARGELGIAEAREEINGFIDGGIAANLRTKGRCVLRVAGCMFRAESLTSRMCGR